MTSKIAIVEASDILEIKRWLVINRKWIAENAELYWHVSNSATFYSMDLRPCAEISLDNQIELTSLILRAERGGFVLSQHYWMLHHEFGELASKGEFSTAMGRLLHLSPQPLSWGTENRLLDQAPEMIASDILHFSISAEFDGVICQRLPAECLWISPSTSRYMLGLLCSGREFEEAVEALYKEPTPYSAKGHAYLPAMMAVRAEEVIT